ncbi:hypothetical protein [Sporofaciens sp. JLR.KK001]|uniref:hypothetical protein n=1 Tax=Sporofaciens sp. JLR.KK001 TaxID=3112621 RepID=UPI002FF25706
MIVFYAFTPYQIFNCVNIKLSWYKKNKAILILINPNENNLFEFCSKKYLIKIFAEIISLESGIVDYNHGFIKKIITYCYSLYRLRVTKLKILKINISDEVTDIFTYGSSPELYIIDNYVTRKNGYAARLITYEEGTGSYLWVANNALNSIYTFFLKVFINVKVKKTFDELLLYSPSCISYSKVCNVKAMPRIDIKQNIDIFNGIFNVKNINSENCILLLGPDQNIDLKIAEIFKDLQYQSLRVRLHPRSKKIERYNSLMKSENQRIMWEMVCMNSDLSDSVLISYFSTSTFTPKLIFGMEPYLIFLFNMDELKHEKYTNDEGVLKPIMIDLFENFRDTYEDKDRIFCPTNLEELKEICYHLKVK